MREFPFVLEFGFNLFWNWYSVILSHTRRRWGEKVNPKYTECLNLGISGQLEPTKIRGFLEDGDNPMKFNLAKRTDSQIRK